MNIEHSLMLMIIFFAGVIVGVFLPIICIKLYNAVGISMGEICDEDDGEDQNDR